MYAKKKCYREMINFLLLKNTTIVYYSDIMCVVYHNITQQLV